MIMGIRFVSDVIVGIIMTVLIVAFVIVMMMIVIIVFICRCDLTNNPLDPVASRQSYHQNPGIRLT